MNLAERFYRSNWNLEDGPLLDRLVEKTTYQRIRKGEIISKEGEVQSQIYFLLQGIFRGYFLDINGREITDCIEFQWGDALTSCTPFGKFSLITIEALSDSDVLTLPSSELLPLFQFPDLIRTYCKYLEASLEKHWKTKINMYKYSAEERYLWFLENFPGLAGKIKERYIASFLGISPVTLSRIKKKLIENSQ